MKDGRLVDADIHGLSADSRKIEPGFLFAALPGAETDGRDYIADAVRRGAVAVLSPPGTEIGTEIAVDGPPVALLHHDMPRRRYAELAARFHGGQPAHLAAVTGTNGKTSVVDFTRQLWTRLGSPAASLGTLGLIAPNDRFAGGLTTPDPADLHLMLRGLVDGGTDHAAIEASSHGLHQFRLDGVQVSVAAFTNLSRDHLDYHGSMGAYLEAKARLFSELLQAGGGAVLNADDPHFGEFTDAAEKRGGRLVSYGKAGAELILTKCQPHGRGQRLGLSIFGTDAEIDFPLIGDFQVMNALCALGIVIVDGAEPSTALGGLEKLEPVPGRMQLAAARGNGAQIYVDYAHTPDALRRVLAALRPHASGALAVMFGCGGDRDAGKRPEMGRIAARLADRVIVTDDNPRTEDAGAIRGAIMEAAPGAREIGDREQAIFEAVSGLGAGDILVIAGKGHEQGQIFGAEIKPFDDLEVARRAARGVDQ